MGTATHDFFTSRDRHSRSRLLPAGRSAQLTALTAPGRRGRDHFIPSIGKGEHTVQKAAPVIQLHQSSASTDLGQPVTFTASITPVSVSAAAPAGTVQFTDNGVALLGPVPFADGRAVLTTSSLGAGSHVIQAQYSGDANHQSVATQATHAVRSPATSTTLTSSPNPSTPGQGVLLEATVSAVDGVTPTGTVVFGAGGGAIGFASLVSGKASLSVSTLSPGPHALTASYGGDATHTASTSPAITHTVNRHASTTVLTSGPDPSLVGQSVLLRATVTTTGDGPTGTVSFRDGATVLGTAPLSGGVATLAVSSLAAGAHPLSRPTAATPPRPQHVGHGDAHGQPASERHCAVVSANPSVPGQAVASAPWSPPPGRGWSRAR